MAPAAAIFMSYSEFVWADRYLYLGLPPTILAFGVLWAPRRGRRTELVALGLGALFVAFSCGRTAKWSHASELFEACAVSERSPKCVHLAIEARFDESACQVAPLHFLAARALSAEQEWLNDPTFRAETPFYESLCIADTPLPLTDQMKMVQDVKSAYRQPFYTILGEVLLLLQVGKVESAKEKAFASYLSPETTLPEASNKLLSLAVGQADALCTIVELQRDLQNPGLQKAAPPKKSRESQECESRAQTLKSRLRGISVNPTQQNWGFSRTIEAFNRSTLSHKPQDSELHQ
jgi:hypothetical protein